MTELRITDWARDGAALSTVRFTVFVDEQGVPRELELDAADADAVHVIALDDDGRAIGTGRLLADGHIGRMAILKSHRGQGLGRAILKQLTVLAAQAGHESVFLHAQTSAEGFYRKAGFLPEGAAFEDAGIPHVTMRLQLGGAAGGRD